MEGKINKGKKVLAETLELPKEVMLNIPRIVIIGNEELTIENHKGVLNFDKNEVKIKTILWNIKIKGENFEILYITASTLIINGVFYSIEYER